MPNRARSSSAVSPRTRLGTAEIAELDHIEILRNVLSEHQMIYRAIERQVQILLAQHPDAQRVHQGIARI